MAVFRISMQQILLQFAEMLAQRSTCKRLQVGAVLTDLYQLQVLGIGYNGNARGFPNACDSDVPGACGCIHAELNALLKAPGIVPKLLFVTDAPCVACAKAAVNANVQRVIYRRVYRDNRGLLVLAQAKIEAIRFPTQDNYVEIGLKGPGTAPE